MGIIDPAGYMSCSLAGGTYCNAAVSGPSVPAVATDEPIAKLSIKTSKGAAVITGTGIKATVTATGEAIKGGDLVVSVAGVYSLVPRPDLALSRSAGGGAGVARAAGGAPDGGLTAAQVVMRVSKKGGAPSDYAEVTALLCLGAKPTANLKKCDVDLLAPFVANGTNLLPAGP
jgi:hypothetical protein